jgi:DNA replication protein DnaC
MEDRYEKKSLIITSQLPVSKWHEYLEEPSLADYPHFLIMRSTATF